MNETLFGSLDHDREALADWKNDYNTVRLHSAIGNVPPAVYAKLSDPVMQWVGSPELPWGSAPRLLHHRANKAQIKAGLYLQMHER